VTEQSWSLYTGNAITTYTIDNSYINQPCEHILTSANVSDEEQNEFITVTHSIDAIETNQICDTVT
jgi:hypothetical protein